MHISLVDMRGQPPNDGLRHFQKFMQSARDDVVDRQPRQFIAQLPEFHPGRTALWPVRPALFARPDPTQRVVQGPQTIPQRTRKTVRKHQKLGHLLRQNLRHVKPPIGFQRTRRTQDCLPLRRINGPAHIGRTRQQNMIFNVEDARRFVRPFKIFSKLQEIPPLSS